ncbi:hypothetical protein CQW23_01025 [Capsicum baccatum]|uniref:Uncharacterized protein n=1 Tax=Capsicum baccatum TaxID=33114 RepID=A0A2G2XMF2_CAPBA|nr:hypothetical protein CQW23_01025 [Capsicum baccatum]
MEIYDANNVISDVNIEKVVDDQGQNDKPLPVSPLHLGFGRRPFVSPASSFGVSSILPFLLRPSVYFSSDEVVACRLVTNEIQFLDPRDFSRGFVNRLRVPGVAALELSMAPGTYVAAFVPESKPEQNIGGHYRLSSLQPVDKFPHTPHIECVCLLELR